MTTADERREAVRSKARLLRNAGDVRMASCHDARRNGRGWRKVARAIGGRKLAREREALAIVVQKQQLVLSRAQALAARLACDLEKCVLAQRAMARELGMKWL